MCYTLPALASGKLVVVVSPLIGKDFTTHHAPSPPKGSHASLLWLSQPQL